MVILGIYGIKVLAIFAAEYRTTFFGFILKNWAFVLLFLHPSSVESGGKNRRMKIFNFVNEFLVYMFVSLYSMCSFNCLFNF